MDNKILDELVQMQNVVLDIRESLDRLSPIPDTEENLTILKALHNGLTSHLVVINSHIPQPTTPTMKLTLTTTPNEPRNR